MWNTTTNSSSSSYWTFYTYNSYIRINTTLSNLLDRWYFSEICNLYNKKEKLKKKQKKNILKLKDKLFEME